MSTQLGLTPAVLSHLRNPPMMRSATFEAVRTYLDVRSFQEADEEGLLAFLQVKPGSSVGLAFDEFETIDLSFDLPLTLVIGANDVVNPAARSKKESPLYGMPILNADQAHTVMILKRSLSPGFAGEDNELFFDKKTMMIFGDAKAILTSLIQLLKKTATAKAGKAQDRAGIP